MKYNYIFVYQRKFTMHFLMG